MIKKLLLCSLIALFFIFAFACDEKSTDDSKDIFTCNDEVCKDQASGLMWQMYGDSFYPWDKAEEYCQNLSLGGYDDWRTPNISELRSLIRGCPTTEITSSCGVTNDCLSFESCWSELCDYCDSEKGPSPQGYYWPPELKDNHSYYSSSSIMTDVKDFGYHWGVDFFSGGLCQIYALDSEIKIPVKCIHDLN